MSATGGVGGGGRTILHVDMDAFYVLPREPLTWDDTEMPRSEPSPDRP